MAIFVLPASGCLSERNSYRPKTGLQCFSLLFRLFPSRGDKKSCAAFCTIRLDLLQGMSAEFFEQKIENLTCPCSNIEQNLAKTLDPTLKPSIF